jgi:hypothetical protein
VNELEEPARAMLLDRLTRDARAGRPVLVVEPIARRDKEWWPSWVDRLGAEGAREDEWRFRSVLPSTLREIAKGAGLDPRELTARTLYRPSRSSTNQSG